MVTDFDSDVAIDMKSLQKSPSMGLRRSVSGCMSFSDNEFASRLKGRRSTSVRVVAYSLTDLQNATTNFASSRILGEGTIGRVYKAKYQDGKVDIFFYYFYLLFSISFKMAFNIYIYIYLLVSGFSSEKDRFVTVS